MLGDFASLDVQNTYRGSDAYEPRVINLEELKNDVKNHPDSYQWERAQRFGVSQHCIQHWLNFLGISCKKNTKTSKSQRKYTYKLPE
ncbi:IS630 transposase-related protein [Piscirickettsia salmonis]|uniref:IS630 transposase-related protein n=1 Tax=Piscirickettsia salmonis TaxID=1238 RepID=UPI001E3BF492|nr:IS630 transposase-related protein [Piscirickettsia salmonis]